MAKRIIDFLQDQKASATFVNQSLIDMQQQSVDRFTNALPKDVSVAGLDTLTSLYLNLLEKKDENPAHFATTLMRVACSELLDQEGKLHPIIATRFKLTEDQRTTYRAQMLKGFAHHLFQEIIASKKMGAVVAKALQDPTQAFAHRQAEVNKVISDTLKDPKKLALSINNVTKERQLRTLLKRESPLLGFILKDKDFYAQHNLSDYMQILMFKLSDVYALPLLHTLKQNNSSALKTVQSIHTTLNTLKEKFLKPNEKINSSDLEKLTKLITQLKKEIRPKDQLTFSLLKYHLEFLPQVIQLATSIKPQPKPLAASKPVMEAKESIRRGPSRGGAAL